MDTRWKQKALDALASGKRPSDIFKGIGLTLARTLRLAVHEVAGLSARAQSGALVRNCQIGAKRARLQVPDASKVDLATPAGRLIRFLRLLDHLGTAPWASSSFAANTEVMERLTASHLGLIVGCKPPPPELFRLIGGAAVSLERCENLIWITNRQQGKTTTMGRFIAALALQVQSGGTLACVYSTKQDRAAELCKAAKDYMYWMQTDKGRHPEWPSIVFESDNQRQFTVRTGLPGSPAASVYARPKNADACRGDAPAAAFFDEIAFTSPGKFSHTGPTRVSAGIFLLHRSAQLAPCHNGTLAWPGWISIFCKNAGVLVPPLTTEFPRPRNCRFLVQVCAAVIADSGPTIYLHNDAAPTAEFF